eukprot:TRINITY_DN137_c0_g1_i1.p1 TRINITY_DN137_c0_g1~~TRINITY_DN137_c0_g1_i1.p1  ORF type:complete len:528 (+),score=109.56 TRINITY_DN137_c0_g1_i1:39-1586(+)
MGFPLFSLLPADIKELIFMHLPPADVASASKVCREWVYIIESGSTYKNLIHAHLKVTLPQHLIFSNHLIAASDRLVQNASPHWKNTFKALYKQAVRKDKPAPCRHYTRGNLIRAECCGDFFSCRFCHDATADHVIDRFSTKVMMCKSCHTVQEPAKNCSSCDAVMGSYFCLDCKLWSSHPEIDVYHCDKCGLCRLGKGLGIDNFHCDTCGICLSKNVFDRHRCTVKGGLKTTCPHCDDPTLLFYSREPVLLRHCGHGTHLRCFREADNDDCLHCDNLALQNQPGPLIEAVHDGEEAHHGHHHGHHHDHHHDHHHGHHHDHHHGGHAEGIDAMEAGDVEMDTDEEVERAHDVNMEVDREGVHEDAHDSVIAQQLNASDRLSPTLSRLLPPLHPSPTSSVDDTTAPSSPSTSTTYDFDHMDIDEKDVGKMESVPRMSPSQRAKNHLKSLQRSTSPRPSLQQHFHNLRRQPFPAAPPHLPQTLTRLPSSLTELTRVTRGRTKQRNPRRITRRRRSFNK